jgi:FkbM family methyltransferase
MPYQLRQLLKLNSPYLLTINGKEILVPINVQDSIYNLYINKSWKTEIISYFVKKSEGVFVDVGANLGQTLIDFWMTGSENSYVGFEPNKICIDYLNTLITINKLGRYKIIPSGLFNENKSLPLYIQNSLQTDACATVVEDLRPDRKYNVYPIQCQKFDDIFPEFNINSISLIKIDVEGSELEVLQGMTTTVEKLKPIILCEVLFTDKKADLLFTRDRNETLVKLLDKWEYSIFQIIKNYSGSKVIDFKRISSFPIGYWNLGNKDLCDYLFIPKEKEDILKMILHR